MNIKEFDLRLQQHDWYYRESDDGHVYRAGKAAAEALEAAAKLSPHHAKLYKAYVGYGGHGIADRVQIERMELDQVRVEVGATTQAELDALVREKQEKAQREAAEQKRKLLEYDQRCAQHNWFYWKSRTDSAVYQNGLKEREWLTTWFSYWDKPDYEYKALFRVWGAYASKPQLITERDEVRKRLGVLV